MLCLFYKIFRFLIKNKFIIFVASKFVLVKFSLLNYSIVIEKGENLLVPHSGNMVNEEYIPIALLIFPFLRCCRHVWSRVIVEVHPLDSQRVVF